MIRSEKKSRDGNSQQPTPDDEETLLLPIQAPKYDLTVAPLSSFKARVEITCGDKAYVDELNPCNGSARLKTLRQAAKHLQVDVKALAILNEQFVPMFEQQLESMEAQDCDKDDQDQDLVDPFAESLAILKETDEETLQDARRFLKNPQMIDELLDDFEKLGIAGEKHLATTLYMVGTSRLLPTPLGGVIQSASGSGKSYVKEKVVLLFPPEQLLDATTISAQALYRLPPGFLIHRFVVVAERKHSDPTADKHAMNETLALREMLSRGSLCKVVCETIKGKLTSVTINQPGPIAYLETTTQELIIDEDASRLLSLRTDESPGQTKRIIEQMTKQAAGISLNSEERDRIVRKHQAAQRLLKARDVRIPFAQLLTIPTDRVIVRRAFGQLLCCIQAVALLRQYQKPETQGSIIASLNDYRIAYRLMLPVLRRALQPISEPALKLLGDIREQIDLHREFTRQDAVKWSGVSTTSVTTRLKELQDFGLVDQPVGGQGKRSIFRLLASTGPQAQRLAGLPAPNELYTMLEQKKAARKKLV